MNTQGWIRGLMSRNMKDPEFFNHVTYCISRDFEVEVSLVMTEIFYGLSFEKYRIMIPRERVTSLRLSSPYSLDRHIFDMLQEQGFKLDRYRSQYVRYCYDLHYKREDGSVY